MVQNGETSGLRGEQERSYQDKKDQGENSKKTGKRKRDAKGSKATLLTYPVPNLYLTYSSCFFLFTLE